jgi:starch phosphorylase
MKASNTWYKQQHGDQPTPVLAYFSMEFGLTESLQNYSGGLGVLSGDHLKSASDLGLPLVGVGILYQEGYFRQYLNVDGYQQESYPINDYANLPVTLMRDASGKPIKISVQMPGRELFAVIWKVQVGRVPLYLLDSNIADNKLPEDRNLTDRLYGGDRRTRIRQEILMGIGGIRALDALGLRPHLCHMNEGHSAFLGLERIRQLMTEHKLTFQQAREIAKAGTIFTTHTPVPAGLERFGFDLIDEHFTTYFAQIGLTREQFIDLGREDMGDYQLFSMAVLALNLSSMANGVAKLHGKVSRRIWNWLYPYVPEHEIPVTSVTNGIHIMSWISDDMASLLDRYLNPAWRDDTANEAMWQDIDIIPDDELWRIKARRRERLVAFIRRRLRAQLARRGATPSEIEAAEEVLNPEALTIGFARRFATYKRAALLFRDMERLKRILSHAQHPVQIIFAGKAHPHDAGGKDLIRQIVHAARQPELRHSVVFLEDYDMYVARYLVQGVDVWLNNPRRPQEASGTSGMKVLANGGLNCSILDGWWDEAYEPSVGWAIGNGEEYPEGDEEHQDFVESQAIYNVIENDIVPLFYERGRDGLPRGWIAKMKASMRKLSPRFTTRRMVMEYTEQMYMPSLALYRRMTEPDFSNGVTFATWRARLNAAWSGVKINQVRLSEDHLKVGSDLVVEADVSLGQLTPADVSVQLYWGSLTPRGEIGSDGEALDMQPVNGDSKDGVYKYTARIAYQTSGDRGVSVRVLPYHDALPTSFIPGKIVWAY